MGLVDMPGIRMRVVLEDGTVLNVNSVINEKYKNQLITLVCFADPDALLYTFPVEAGFALVEDFENIDVYDYAGNPIIADEADYMVDINGNPIYDIQGNQILTL